MSKKEKEYCPAKSGTTTGYRAQYYCDSREDWLDIRFKTETMEAYEKAGYPLCEGGVLRDLNLLGKDQALAIIHSARAKANSENRHMIFRIRVFKIEFDLKVEEVSDE